MKTGCHKPLVNVDRGLDLGTPGGSEWPFHTVIIIKAVNNTTVDVGFRNIVYSIPTSSVTIEAAAMQLGLSSATMTPSPTPRGTQILIIYAQ